jgi:hypothetical protein
MHDASEMTISPLSDALPEPAIVSPEPRPAENHSASGETVTFHEGSLVDREAATVPETHPDVSSRHVANGSGAELGDIVPLDEKETP